MTPGIDAIFCNLWIVSCVFIGIGKPFHQVQLCSFEGSNLPLLQKERLHWSHRLTVNAEIKLFHFSI